MSEKRDLTVRVHGVPPELWAEVVELPGVFASGDTMAELRDSLREAVELYLDKKVESEVWSADSEHVEEHQVAVYA